MAIIAPFRGWRYNREKVDLNKVVAPPYDVIDAAEQVELYALDPHNVIRLILGRQFPDDSPEHNRYTRAADHLAEWRADGTILRDAPAFYLYEQEFNARAEQRGPQKIRRGYFARILLSEWGKGGIHPHEKTLAGPKADRLDLMRATHGNLEPVFGLQTDPHGTLSKLLADLASKGKPVADVPEGDGCRNRLFVIDDEADLKRFEPFAGQPTIYIADGHHRYETALAYRNEYRAKHYPEGTPAPAYGALDCDYILMLVVPDSDPGLVIWPTHRMVYGVADFSLDKLLDGCRKDFDVQPFEGTEALLADMDSRPEPAFGLAAGGKLWRLRLKDADAMARRDPEAAPAWRALDVSVLHRLILEDLLGIDEGRLLRKENIRYTKSVDEAIDAANKKTDDTQCSFLLRSTRMDQLLAVADAGTVMPQKSTYFYPKALSGLIFNLFDDA